MTSTDEICNVFFNLEVEDDRYEAIIQRIHDMILKFKRLKSSKYYLITQKIKREVKSKPTFQESAELLENLFGSIRNENNMKYDIVQMFLITEVVLEFSSKYLSSDEYYRLKNVAPKLLAEAIKFKYQLNKSQWTMLMNDWIEEFAGLIQNVTVLGLILYSLHHIMK